MHQLRGRLVGEGRMLDAEVDRMLEFYRSQLVGVFTDHRGVLGRDER
jgi:hypothetical protein